MPVSRYRSLAVLALITLLATWLRFYRIEFQSYWNDEGNSLGLARQSAGALMLSAAADVHPPGYYLALKIWRALAGETEFALRGLSALAGIVLVALLYRAGREYFDPRAAVAAAFLGAVNPFLVYYAQEARMYSVAATLGAASFLLFSRWLRSTRPQPSPQASPIIEREQRKGLPSPAGELPDGGRAGDRGGLGRWDLGLAYCLVSGVGLYTHYAFAFVIISQNLAALGGLLAHRRGNVPRRLSAWLTLQAITLALFLPWLRTAYRHMATWPAVREFHPFLSSLADVARYLAFGRTINTEQVGLALVLVGGTLVFGLLRRGQTITPLLWLVVPAGLTLGLGLLTEAFSKFLLLAVPPVCLLLGHGFAASFRSPRTLVAPVLHSTGKSSLGFSSFVLRHSPIASATLCLAFFASATYFSLHNLYFDPAYFRDDYRGIARYVESIQRPGDAIITISPNQVEAFGYYHRPEAGGAPVFPLPHTRPLDQDETASALADIAAAHDRIFVLYWGEAQADPGDFVENWLSSHTFKAGDTWYGQVRLATYAAATPAAEIAAPSGGRFGEHITLLGYTLKSSDWSPGDILPITLFWQTDAALKERYKVFVHLYAALDQPPVAQQDGEPGGGLNPTNAWEAGRAYADNHGVPFPAELPADEYTLTIGLYNLFDGTRLPIWLGDQAIGDRLELETITVN